MEVLIADASPEAVDRLFTVMRERRVALAT
jgi:hypothetical protein